METKDYWAEYERKHVRSAARTKRTERQLTERDGRNRCYVCDERFPPILTKHHIRPVAKGGEAHRQNIIRLCPNCHSLVHWLSKWPGLTVHERRDLLRRFDMTKGRKFKLALISTEEVAIDDDGNIVPRTRIYPKSELLHVELYDIFNWRPDESEAVA